MSRLRPRRSVLLGTASIVVVLVFWQLAVKNAWVNPLFLAAPTDAVRGVWDMFSTGEIWHDLALSAEEFAYGLLLSLLVGVVLGIAYGWYAPVRELLSPIVTAINGMPQIALIPVFILWLGIGISSKIAIIFLMTVTTFLLNTAAGISTIDQRYIRVARSFGAGDLALFRTVALPHSLPYILTGLRLGIGRALIGVVVGELFASAGGIGHVLISASNNFDTKTAYAALLIITAFGIILTSLVGVLERRYQQWRE